jgi:hypothetical protein
MNFFVRASNGSPNHLRVHPLFLSLTAHLTSLINLQTFNPFLKMIQGYLAAVTIYTLPSDLPPLNIHFPGQNGMANLSDNSDSLLVLASSLSRMYVF